MTSTPKLRQEVLQLYREILRTARIFRGQKNEANQDFCKVICESARSELNGARQLTSAEDIMRRIVTARMALEELHRKVCCISYHTDPVSIMHVSRLVCSTHISKSPKYLVVSDQSILHVIFQTIICCTLKTTSPHHIKIASKLDVEHE